MTDADTDDEYDTGITAHNSSRLRNLDEIYMRQRGLCRITQIPFSEGLYTCRPRCVRKPLSEENAMLVLKLCMICIRQIRTCHEFFFN